MLGLNFLRQLLGLASTVVLVRIFTHEQFGYYQTVLSVVGICGIFALGGLAGAIIQAVARGHEGTYRKAQLLSFCGSCVGAIVILAIALYFWWYVDHSVGYALAVAGLLFPFFQGLLGWQALQAGKEQFKNTALNQSLFLIISYGLIILAALAAPSSIVFPIAIYYLALSIQNVRMSVRAAGLVSKDAAVEPGIIPYGLRMSFYDMFNIAGNHVDKFILLSLLAPADLAVYAVAGRIPELLKDNLQSIRSVMIPGLSRQKTYTAQIDRKLNALSLMTLAGLVFVALAIVPWLFPLIFSAKYAEGTLYCQLLLFSVAIGTFATTKYTFILAKMDEKSVRRISIYPNVFRIACAAIFIPAFGVLGAVFSTILYRMATAVTVQIHLKKYYLQKSEH